MWKFLGTAALATTLGSVTVPSIATADVLDVGAHSSVFSGNVRGFWFTAPTTFYIGGIDVPTEASTSPFNTSIIRFSAPPPTFSSTTAAYEILHEARAQMEAVTGISIQINAGDIIGVLGNRDDRNSYGASPFLSSILGMPVTLTRLGSQNRIGGTTTIAGFEVFSEDSGSISRVFLTIGGVPFLIGPSAQDELAQLVAAAGGAARLVVVDAAGVSRDLGQLSLATRDAAGGFVRGVDGGVTMSSQGAPGLTNGLYTWADVTSFRTTQNGGGLAELGGSGIQIGADIAIGTDMVAGVSLGYSDINATDGGIRQDGELVFVQPYFAYSAGAWHGNASVIFGRGQYDQTSIGGAGTGETELLAFTFEGGYDMALEGGFTLTPTLGVIHGREVVEGTGGTLAGAGSETYTFSQGSIGARLSLDGADGSLFAGLHADYLTQDAGAVLTGDLLSDDGWTGRVEVGASTDLGHGFGLSTSIELSGLGGAAQTFSGGLRVALTF